MQFSPVPEWRTQVEVVFGGGRGFALGDSIRDVAEHDAALLHALLGVLSEKQGAGLG